jgi:hypothetical protein
MSSFFVPRTIPLPKKAKAAFRSVAQQTSKNRAQPSGVHQNVTVGPSGQSHGLSLASLRGAMMHGSRIIQCAQISTTTYTGSNNGQTGWYDAKLAVWKGKGSSSTPDTEADFITSTTAALAAYNLNQMTLSTDNGCNNPPIINTKGPLIIHGALIANDQGTPAKKTLIFDSDCMPRPAPGIIVTTGPTGQANFADTYPQQYWVQQAVDSSSDSTGSGTVTLSGLSNAPIWAVTNISQFSMPSGPRLATSTAVEVFFLYNNAGVLKAFIATPSLYGGLFYCACTQSGGVAGTDGSVTCTFTYTCKDVAGNSLNGGSAASVKRSRIPNLKYTAGTLGAYTYDSSGNFVLLAVEDEAVADTTNCTT